MSSEPWAFQIDANQAEEVTLKMYSGAVSPRQRDASSYTQGA